MTTLAEKFNGADGSPKFVPEEIANYMDEKGISDPEVAYKAKYLDQLAEIKAKASRGTAFSEKPGQPMQTASFGDDRSIEIAKAKESGDWSGFFQKYISSIKS